MNREKKHGIRLTALMLLAVLLAGLLSGCGESAGKKIFSSLNDFQGTTLGVLSGNVYNQPVEEVIGDVSFNSYPDVTGEVSALNTGDIDGVVLDLSVATYMVAQHPEFAVFPEEVAPDSYGFALPKGSSLTDEFTAVIRDLYADGTLDALQDKWFFGDDEEQAEIDWDQYNTGGSGKGTLHCVYEDTKVPISYEGDDGKACGYEPEVLLNIAERLGMGIEFEGVAFSSLISYIETGKADVACGGISVTEERSESVDFPESHYVGGIMIVCRADDIAADAAGGAEKVYEDLKDFEGSTLGMPEGAVFDGIVSEVLSDVAIETYADLTEEMSALDRGDIDAMISDQAVAQYQTAQQPQYAIFPKSVREVDYGFGLQKDSPYKDLFSNITDEFYSDGTIEALQEKWFSADGELMKIDWDQYDLTDRGNGTLHVVCSVDFVPMAYDAGDGTPAGYEAELLLKIAERLEMGVSWDFADADSLIGYLESGRADAALGSLTITAERREEIDFPTADYQGSVVLVCRSENLTSDTAEEESQGFWAGLKDSFEKTFIREDRWQMIGNGLLITLEITVLAMLFGTILGFGLCLLLRSKNRVASTLSSLFCKLIEGIPDVVLLLVVYFVIFASSTITAFTVAVIVFSVLFAVTVGGLLTDALGEIPPEQREAASALGFGRADGFWRVIMPQAVRQALPSYQKDLVSLLKSTSIVGYIAIVDLTKAADIIRSRTYEAFFPLILTAVIYLLIAILINVLFSRLIRHLTLHRRRGLPRGVKEPAETAADSAAGPAAPENTPDSGTGSVIDISHVKKEDPDASALRDISASVRPGETAVVIGPPGAGKSTLLRCLNRLETPAEGEIFVFGEDVCGRKTDLKKIRRRMGMVFSPGSLFPHLTIAENVMLAPMRLKKQTRQEAYENAMDLLKSVGLAEKAQCYPDELSAGQQQRAAIARTLAMEPEIVLFDDPTAGLDPAAAGEVQSVIRNLASSGLTMVIVSDDVRLAQNAATRVFYMDRGEILEEGTPEEIFRRPDGSPAGAFLRQQSTLQLVVSSPDYDFIGMEASLRQFGEKHQLESRRTECLCSAFQALAAENIVPRCGGKPDLTVTAEFSEETDDLVMRFVWSGERFDPFREGDPLSTAPVRGFIKSEEYSYEDGINRMTVVL